MFRFPCPDRSLFRLQLLLGVVTTLLAVTLGARAAGASSFEENLGQFPDSILFAARSGSGAVFVSAHGLTIVTPPDSNGVSSAAAWFGFAERGASVLGEAVQPARTSYFIGDDPGRWVRAARTFAALSLRSPGGGVSGALALSENGLEIAHVRGRVSPVAVDREGTSPVVLVEAEYADVGRDGRSASHLVERVVARAEANRPAPYDRLPSGIDAASQVMLGGSYLGASGIDRITEIARAANGDLLVAGTTTSLIFPGAGSGYQTTRKSSYDLFVARFDATLHTLIACTYLGGAGTESMGAVTADVRCPVGALVATPGGDVVIAACTRSTDFPCVGGSCAALGAVDIAIAELSGDLTSLVRSSVLGGAGYDYVTALARQADGHWILCGSTNSDLTLPGAQQATRGGGYDGLLLRLTAEFQVERGRYCGGSYGDYWNAAVLDPASGDAFVVGTSASRNFPQVDPLTGSAAIPASENAVVARFAGTTLDTRWASVLGGSAIDDAVAVALDANGDMVVAGSSYSTTFPFVATRHLPDFVIANEDHLLLLGIRADGHQVRFAQIWGGEDDDWLTGVAVDAAGRIHAVGLTQSKRGFPVAAGWQMVPGDALTSLTSEGFEAVLAPDASSILAASFLGGVGHDEVNGLVLSSNGEAWLGGATASKNLATRFGWSGYQVQYGGQDPHGGGSSEGFVAHVRFDAGDVRGINTITPKVVGAAASVGVSISGTGFGLPAIVAIEGAGGSRTGEIVSATSSRLDVRFDLSGLATGDYVLTVTNADGLVMSGPYPLTVEAARCSGATVYIVTQRAMRPGPNRPSRVELVLRNDCNVDVVPPPVSIEVRPPSVQITPRTPYETMPTGPGYVPVPAEIDDETIIVGGANVLPLIPETLSPGGTESFQADLDYDGSTTGPNGVDQVEVEVSVPAATPGDAGGGTGGSDTRWSNCLWSLGEELATHAADMVTDHYLPALSPCISNARDALIQGYRAVRNDRDYRRNLFWNDLQFMTSVFLAVPLCSRDALRLMTAADELVVTAKFVHRLMEARKSLEEISEVAGLASLFDDCLPLLKDEGTVQVLNSRDPNAIRGPVGAGAAASVRGNAPLPYTILFENARDATAAATDVILRHRLDPAVFDLHALRFDRLGFGDSDVPLSALANGDTLSYDLPDLPGYVLLVSVSMDTLSGDVIWRLLTREAGTLAVPPLAGFLPPNDDAGDGEGQVSFTVPLRSGLPSGTRISQQATITFDANPAISTNVWENELDTNPPVSHLTADAPNALGRVALHWDGADDVSGVRDYTVFAEHPDGSRHVVALLTSETSTLYAPLSDGAIRFTAIARDTAGNATPSAQAATASVVVGRGAGHGSVLGVAPNPFRESSTLAFTLPTRDHVRLGVYAVTGARVRALDAGWLEPGLHELSWDGRDDGGRSVAPGVYWMRLESSSTTGNRCVVRLR